MKILKYWTSTLTNLTYTGFKYVFIFGRKVQCTENGYGMIFQLFLCHTTYKCTMVCFYKFLAQTIRLTGAC